MNMNMNMNDYMLDDAKLEKILAKIKRRKYNNHDIFGINSVIFQDQELKLLLFHYQHKSNRCDKCSQLGIWNKKPLEMLIYRKNKNPKDNRLENIVLMCPNCYSHTDSQKIWIKHKNKKMRCCIDCGKKYRIPIVKKIVDPCADIGTEKSNYIDTRPQVKKGGEERTRCPKCLEVQIQKKDYTKLNKIKKEVNLHVNLKLDINNSNDYTINIHKRLEDLSNNNILPSEKDNEITNNLKHITL